MLPAPDPVGRLAGWLAALRTDQHPEDGLPNDADTDFAASIVESIRMEVRVEEASRGAKLSLRGLCWVLAGSVLTIVFNNILAVPVLAVLGGAATIIGFLIMIFALRAQHLDQKADEAKYDPHIVAAVKAERKAHDRAHRAARIRALRGRFTRGS